MLDRLIIDRKNYKDGRPVDEEIMILKFLKIYRNQNKTSSDDTKLYSLKDLLKKADYFLQDKVFQLNIEKEENTPEFKFVYLKIIRLKDHEQE